MSYEVYCKDLGASECEMGFRGETKRDVVERCVSHLQATHHVAMPGIDQVIGGNLQSVDDPDVRQIVIRLRERLNLAEEAALPPQK